MRFEVDKWINFYDRSHSEAWNHINEAFEAAETEADFQRILDRIEEAKKQGQVLKRDIKRKIPRKR